MASDAMKRYGLAICSDYVPEMAEAADGDYVEYETAARMAKVNEVAKKVADSMFKFWIGDRNVFVIEMDEARELQAALEEAAAQSAKANGEAGGAGKERGT